jgi:hypothetical protein
MAPTLGWRWSISRRAAQPPPTSDHSQSSHATWRAVWWQALPYRHFRTLAVDFLGSLCEPLDKSPEVLTYLWMLQSASYLLSRCGPSLSILMDEFALGWGGLSERSRRRNQGSH